MAQITTRRRRTEHFSLRLEREVKDRLDLLAEREDVSASWLARRAIKLELDRRERELRPLGA